MENFYGVAFQESAPEILRFFCEKYGEEFKHVCPLIEEFNRKYKNTKIIIQPGFEERDLAFINAKFLRDNEEVVLCIYGSESKEGLVKASSAIRGFEMGLQAVSVYGASVATKIPQKTL